jgi:FAD-dependent urate hydroxylase
MLETIVIGGGPYGLSATTHLRKAGVETKTFGSPMSFWRDHTPAGMMLRSALGASDIASPDRAMTLAAYLCGRGAVLDGPVPVSSFVDYGTWFQARRLPDIDRRCVSEILAEQDGFCVVAQDGEMFRAKRVVVATGIAGFAHRPSAFESAPNSLVSHSNDNPDPARFRGRRVGIIGGGQSAIETAALMKEAGAEVEVIMRAARIRWLHGAVKIRDRLGLLGRLVFPWTDVGSPPLNQVIARPALFRTLPAAARVTIDRRTMRASVAAWLKPRIDGVRLSTSRTVVRAEPRHDEIGLVLDDASVRKFDHVVLATGFRINLARLSFLNCDLLAAIQRTAGYPHLKSGFESSVNGLHFIGATAAYSFGSVTRFVAGTTYSAAALTAAICSSSRRVANTVARPESALISEGRSNA